MKHISLNLKRREVLHISAPKKGMDITKPSAHLKEGSTGTLKNMIFDDGLLKTREGLNANLSNILNTEMLDDAQSYEYLTTETEIFYKDENRRVVIANVDYDYSHHFVMVYLIGEKGDSDYMGYIHFMRVDDDTFFVPKGFTFYSGTPQAGGGIFAFVQLENKQNLSQVEYAVYEINENHTEWERAYSYYTPTVYINGRGDSYEEARADNQVSVLNPKSLEAQNLLYNRFYAYFTTDGYSSSFRLPFTDISNTNVMCRVHTSPETYTEWIVGPNETNDTMNFKGVSVTFNVNRQTGAFYFTSNGNDYSMPVIKTYRENNIRIAAQINYDQSFNDVVSCKVSASIGSTILLSGGREKNRIYYTSYENPLYFPKIEENIVGFSDESIENLYRFGDGLYTFKDNKIYTIKLNEGKAINSSSLLADNGKTFYEKYNFKIDCVSDKIGSIKKDTVSFLNGKLIWQGKDDKVYICKENGKVYSISDEIKSILKESRDYHCCGTVCNDRYMLFFGNKAFVFDFKEDKNASNLEKIGRYYWEFPLEVRFSGCMNIGGNLNLLCENTDKTIGYLANFSGSHDNIILNNEQTEKRKISSFVKFKSYYLGEGSIKKKIHLVFLQLTLKGKTKIKIGEGVNSQEFLLNKSGFSTSIGQDSVKLIPDLFGVNLFEMSIESEDSFAFSFAEIYFTKTIV